MVKKSDSMAKRAREFMQKHGAKSLEDFRMNFAGFWRETDANILGAEVFDDPSDFAEPSELAEVEREKIINYLEIGKMVFSITLWLTDDDGTNIGPYMMLCDGPWIWPSHYSYYLRKSNFSIMKRDFLAYLRTRNYEVTKMTKEQKTKVRGFIEIMAMTKAGYL